MGKLLLFAFTVVPLVELYLLLWVGRLVGFWPTVALVLCTGLLGAALAKLEGIRVLTRWQTSLAEGRVPEEGVLDGVLVFIGGLFLITPGVLTDAFGLLMLVPPTRRLFARFIRARIERGVRAGRVHVATFRGGRVVEWSSAAGAGGVIDVEGEEIPLERPALRSPDE